MAVDVHKEVHYFGMVSSSTANTWMDFVKTPASVYPFVDTPESFEVVSSSASDAAGGTGIQVVYVSTIDANGDRTEHEVVLNGTTPVAIPGGPYLRSNILHALDAGSGGVAAGDIDVRGAVSGSVFRRIEVDGNRDQTLCMTAPNQGRFRLNHLDASMEDAKQNDEFAVRMQWRPVGRTAWVTLSATHIMNTSHPDDFVSFSDGLMIPPLADVRVQYYSNATSVLMRATLEVIG